MTYVEIAIKLKSSLDKYYASTKEVGCVCVCLSVQNYLANR